MNLTIPELEEKMDFFEDFLLRNHNIFAKPKKVGNIDYKALEQEVIDSGLKIDPFHGKCFPSAYLIYFMMGGAKASPLDMMMCKTRPYCTIPGSGKVLKTTHWYTQCKETGKIYDLTGRQFIYEVPVQDFYDNGRKGQFGLRRFRAKGNLKSEDYGEVVPSKVVLAFGRKLQEEIGTAYGLDIWIERYDALQAKAAANVH